MIVLYTALRAVPTELYEAARIDGATELQIAWRIKIPMLRPGADHDLRLLAHRHPAGVQRADDAAAADQRAAVDLDPADEDLPGRVRPQRHLLGGRRLGRASPLVTLVLSFGFLRLVQHRAFGGPMATVTASGHDRARPRHRRPLATAAVLLLLGRALLPAAGRLGADRRVEDQRASCSTRSPSPPAPRCWTTSPTCRLPATACSGGGSLNTALYAGVGALLSTAVSGAHRVHPGQVPLPGPRDGLQRPARRGAGARPSSWRSRSTCCWPSSG